MRTDCMRMDCWGQMGGCTVLPNGGQIVNAIKVSQLAKFGGANRPKNVQNFAYNFLQI